MSSCGLSLKLYSLDNISSNWKFLTKAKCSKAKPCCNNWTKWVASAILFALSHLKLLRQWQAYGTIEPTAAEAIATVARTGKWLDLSDRYFIMLGAGSAMGPYPLLMYSLFCLLCNNYLILLFLQGSRRKCHCD